MRRVDRYLAAIRRVKRHIYVVQAAYRLRNLVINLHHHLVGALQPCGRVAHGSAQHYLAVVGYALCLYYGYVHLTPEALAELFGHLAQVAVVVVQLVSVDALAQLRARLIWRTHVDGVCARQLTVGLVVARRAAHYIHLEFTSCLMLAKCLLGDCRRNHFRIARNSKSRNAYRHSVLNVFCGLFGSKYWINHLLSSIVCFIVFNCMSPESESSSANLYIIICKTTKKTKKMCADSCSHIFFHIISCLNRYSSARHR